ncbi:alanine--tRNA ligase [Candidatus Nesciobacter abundans]|uniref:Alanine--tRNA ligase n=1 Tax=Candidatus Nesciobacter abundans TaxID=2601668 RepID=A0A5C0UHE8_9PROT|nr:alanine--tRNA ligase [Candidatus Nesciobacter abundans]QEK39179.1 alanine--tRNA ligase [Candidatus Nesciobacter abundans]
MTLMNQFLNFFENKNHKKIKSFSLIPERDDSILFINSGMAPMKSFFLGQQVPPAKSVVNCQKCLRAGGKHNDLDEVGFTKRHHTFFQMLGNFSFGDYFKEKAIHMSWDFIKSINLDISKIYVTVHPSDLESRKIWSKFVDKSRIIDEKTNEWSAGEEGPCGICTEIFYDHGNHIKGDFHSGDRFIEIWNMVFMTHTVENGIKLKLPNPCVDAGMGLERLEATVSGTNDNYEAPFFKNMLKIITELDFDNKHKSLSETDKRVIADHSRAITFIVSDGIETSSEGRGYVLRRIMRRAMRRIVDKGLENKGIIEACVDYTVQNMSEFYPEILHNKQKVIQSIKAEQEQFGRIYETGMCRLNKYVELEKVSAQNVFELYDTYGFPYDLSFDILREKGIEVEKNEFDRILANRKKDSKKKYDLGICDKNSEFIGYELKETSSKIIDLKCLDITKCKEANDVIKVDKELCGKVFVLLDKTTFYTESGGQASDSGVISTDTGVFVVEEMFKDKNSIWHVGYLKEGELEIGQDAKSSIDIEKRKGLEKHHTSTHILLHVLRKKFGDTVLQKGSSVKHDSLRLDFSKPENITKDELEEITLEINKLIQKNHEVKIESKTFEEAMKENVLITEKGYPSKVRVVRIGQFSAELCCGTHVERVGEIGSFYIRSCKSVSAGVKRIEALTGIAAIKNGLENIKNLENYKNADNYKSKNGSSGDNISKKINSNKADLRNKSGFDGDCAGFDSKNLEELDKNLNVIKSKRGDLGYIECVNLPKSKMKELSDKLIKRCDLLIIINKESADFNDRKVDSNNVNNNTIQDKRKNDKNNSIVIRVNKISKHDFLSAKEYLKEINATGGGREDLVQGSINNPDILGLVNIIKEI